MAYKVQTQKFEGPLDILLSLIEKRKLHINEISLSEVTDDFMKYLEGQENFPLDESANFVLVASTLLLIKSKSLLPTLELTLEEEGSIEDLEKRLREYQRIKELSLYIKKMFGEGMLFPREEKKNQFVVFSPDNKTNLENILSAVRRVLESVPRPERLPKVVVEKVISLEEMISRLTDRITTSLRISFKDFIKGSKSEKVNVIVSFLALLELVKRGAINVRQEGQAGDIHMETTEVGLPKYG